MTPSKRERKRRRAIERVGTYHPPTKPMAAGRQSVLRAKVIQTYKNLVSGNEYVTVLAECSTTRNRRRREGPYSRRLRQAILDSRITNAAPTEAT